jgi:hypothetical protein
MAWTSLLETFLLTRFPQLDLSFRYVTGDREIDPSASSNRSAVIVVSSTDANSPAFAGLLENVGASAPRPRLTILENGTQAAGPTGGALPVDIAGSLAAVVEKARAIDSGAATDIANGVRGQARPVLIASTILEAWRAPALVSSVEIDALRGTVTRTENTNVREMENGRVIAWTQDDEALPMAVDIMDPSVILAIQASDLTRRLDQQILRVRGLAAERYTLTIDGELVGIFHRDQLDAGLNLALLRTPMWKRAIAVLALTRRHDELRASRRKLYEAPAGQRESAEWRAALEALDRAEMDLIAEQRTKLKAGTHDYELQPVEP